MQHSSNASHYTVLNVATDASSAEIKAAYRAAALKDHPDRAKSLERSPEAFLRIQQAYEVNF